MANEKDQQEIRDLLIRHRLKIIEDLILNKSVLRLLLKENLVSEVDFDYLLIKENDVNLTSELNNAINYDKKCDYLIELIAKNGLTCFKRFCFAVEGECTSLITALINDSLNYGNYP